MTNAEKFEDVFGAKPLKICTIVVMGCVKTMKDKVEMGYEGCDDCPYKNWWDKEYEQPDRLPFE